MSKTLFEVENGIAVLRIDRPEARNAIDRDTAEEIAAAVDATDASSDILVLILTGTETGFCSGMDLKAFVRGEIGRVEGRGFAGFTEKPPQKPVIAAVEGYALAGGFELALACDLIVISRTAKVGLPEVKRGLVANAGGLLRLPEQLPPRVAAELVLTGEPRLATELASYGLFNRVVEPGTALSEARALAVSIAANAPLAVSASKTVMQRASDWTTAERFARQREITGRVFSSDDAKEGARAFMEKRPPRWTGT